MVHEDFCRHDICYLDGSRNLAREVFVGSRIGILQHERTECFIFFVMTYWVGGWVNRKTRCLRKCCSLNIKTMKLKNFFFIPSMSNKISNLSGFNRPFFPVDIRGSAESPFQKLA